MSRYRGSVRYWKGSTLHYMWTATIVRTLGPSAQGGRGAPAILPAVTRLGVGTIVIICTTDVGASTTLLVHDRSLATRAGELHNKVTKEAVFHVRTYRYDVTGAGHRLSGIELREDQFAGEGIPKSSGR